MAAKKLTTAEFISQNVGTMSALNVEAEGAIAKTLLEGIAELGHRVIAKSEKIDIGAAYAFAIVNDAKRRKGQPLVKKIDDLNKTDKFGYVKVLRIAAEHETWFDKFISNCETMNASVPVTATTLLHFGRVIFAKDDPVKSCPSVANLKEWRDDMLAAKGKKGKKGKRKSPTAKSETPADRMTAALDCFTGYDTWLPENLHPHVARIMTEMATIVDELPKAAPKVRTEEEKVDAIAALKAKLAKK